MRREGVTRINDSALQPPVGPDQPPGPCMRYVIDIPHYELTKEIRMIYLPEECKPPVTTYNEEFNPKSPRKGRGKVKEVETKPDPVDTQQPETPITLPAPPITIDQLNLTEEIGKVWGNIVEDMKSLKALYIKRAERDFAEQMKEMMNYVNDG